MPDGEQILSLIIAVTILGAGAYTLIGVADTQNQGERIERDSVDITGGSGEVASSFYADVRITDVQQTRGNSLELTGANDSRASGELGVAHDQTWTVSVWLAPDAVTSQRAIQVGNWLTVDLVAGSPDQWRITYFDAGERTVHQLNATAQDPGNITHLVVAANDTRLTAYDNNSQTGSLSLGSGGASVPASPGNWDGRVEELRTADRVINSSTRTQLYQEPVAPTSPSVETARVYFDTLDSGSVPVYWTGSSLDTTNASLADGFDGQPVAEGTDVAVDGAVADVLDGGSLDGAPVAFTVANVVSGPGVWVIQFVETGGSIVQILAAMAGLVAVAYLLVIRS